MPNMKWLALPVIVAVLLIGLVLKVKSNDSEARSRLKHVSSLVERVNRGEKILAEPELTRLKQLGFSIFENELYSTDKIECKCDHRYSVSKSSEFTADSFQGLILGKITSMQIEVKGEFIAGISNFQHDYPKL